MSKRIPKPCDFEWSTLLTCQSPHLDRTERFLLLAVLCASLAGGIALVFLLSEMDDSFATPSDLREAFDFPVLGSVCLVSGKADEDRRYYDTMTVSLGAGALVALCATPYSPKRRYAIRVRPKSLSTFGQQSVRILNVRTRI